MNNYTHHTQVAVHTSDSKESSPVEIGRGAQYKVLARITAGFVDRVDGASRVEKIVPFECN